VKHVPRRLPDEKLECIESLLRMGKSYREVASQCGVNINTVMKYAKTLGREEAAAEPRRSDEDVSATDIKFIMDAIKQRLDPKHPIMSKWVSDVSWWTHLILDFSKLVLPDILKLLEDKDIDIHNPEATARNAAAKFRSVKQLAEERAEKILEYENRIKQLEGEVGVLRSENEKLRQLMREYDAALEKLRAFIEDLRARVRETLVFIIKYVPQILKPEERAMYMHVITPKVKELWGVEVE